MPDDVGPDDVGPHDAAKPGHAAVGGGLPDCCVIGGGAIGLSIARELAGRGLSVRVLARDEPRDTSSWAAAGIFPPAPEWPDAPPNARLTAWSDRLHDEWAEALHDETGIDNELERCGGLYVARAAAALDRLRDVRDEWLAHGTRCEWLAAAAVAAREPALADAVARHGVIGGFILPDERRIRPPRHLAALERSCTIRGVEISRGAAVRSVTTAAGRLTGVVIDVAGTPATVRAGHYVLAAGAWSAALGGQLGLRLDTRPIRGQIVLLRLARQPLGRVVNRGLEYLVPREDGRLLVGSTLEDAGFERATTPHVVERLLAFARDMLGDLPEATVEQVWAGLRPGSIDGLPTIGPVPGLANAFVAAGHFRAGLHQSPGTAVIIADLLEGRPPSFDPRPFAVDRAATEPGPDSVAAMLARVGAPT
jgi:glycine oxidase